MASYKNAEDYGYKHRNRAKQLICFDSLAHMTKRGLLSPIDIDGFYEEDGLYIFYEAKYKDAPMPKGQRLALEHVCDCVTHDDSVGIVILCQHDYDVNEDVDLGNSIVRKYYYKKEWYVPKDKMTTKEMTTWLLNTKNYKKCWQNICNAYNKKCKETEVNKLLGGKDMNFFNIFDTGINYMARPNTHEELKEYVLPITCYMYDECVDKYGFDSIEVEVIVGAEDEDDLEYAFESSYRGRGFANFLSDARYTSNGEKLKNWKEIQNDVADYELHIEDAYTC